MRQNKGTSTNLERIDKVMTINRERQGSWLATHRARECKTLSTNIGRGNVTEIRMRMKT